MGRLLCSLAVLVACGPRGCDHPLEAQDGRVPSAGQTIVATCVGMVCSSTVQ
jgi:hypothetical protein